MRIYIFNWRGEESEVQCSLVQERNCCDGTKICDFTIQCHLISSLKTQVLKSPDSPDLNRGISVGKCSRAMADTVPEKKILLFGKSGDGKSTLANMLVAGNLQNPAFEIGDGMAGVTDKCEVGRGRNYAVVDTVGFGEETEGEVQNPTDLIYEFLKRTKGEYSHILFVKAAGRLDKLDKEIWRIFLKVFAGAEPAFGVVVTKCPNSERWSAENKQQMERTYRECQGRFVFVDFPPENNDSQDIENLLEEGRQQSLARLEAALHSSFERNSFQYCKPGYTELDDSSLRRRAEDVFKYILGIAKQFTESQTVRAIFGLFMPQANIALDLINRVIRSRTA